MPYTSVIAVRTITNTKGKAEVNVARVVIAPNHGNQDHAATVGLTTHLENVRHMAKNVSIAIRRDTSLSSAVPNNVGSLLGPEIHQATDILVVVCMKQTNHNLMTLFSLSKIRLQYSLEPK